MKLNFKEINNCDGFEYYFDGMCYVLELHGETIGLAKCYEDGTSVYISQIEILQEYQANGYGRVFFDLLKERFSDFEEFYGIATVSSYLFWEAMGCKWTNSDKFELDLEDENDFSIMLK